MYIVQNTVYVQYVICVVLYELYSRATGTVGV